MSQQWKVQLKNYLQGALDNQLTEDSPQAEQPAWILAPLRPHQRSLLAAAQALERSTDFTEISATEPRLITRYGVLADRVGAGKSLVALSLVRGPQVNQNIMTARESGSQRIIGMQRMADIQEFQTDWMDLSANELGAVMFDNGRRNRWYSRTAFMIVPHNVVTQWENYITEQTELKTVFIRRTKDCDFERKGFYQDILTADLVVCSCTMLRKFVGAMSWARHMLFHNIVWSRVFVDEADTITCSLRPGDINTRFFWFITGSWLNILFPHGLPAYSVQSMDEAERHAIGNGFVNGVQSSLNIVAQNLSDARDPVFTRPLLRNSDAWIDTSLRRPVVVHETVMCKAPANLGILRDFITPAAMEALHAGDTAGALAALGLKAATQETLAARVTESLRGDLNQAEKVLAFKADMEYSSPSAKAAALEKATAKVQRLREQLASLEGRLASITSQTCPICYDTPRSATLTPCCRQVFCLACLCECIQKKPSCPLCRQSIGSVRELMVVGEGDGVVVQDLVETLPTKGAALLKLLTESSPDQRFLVFSAHEASFKGLREVLSARGIRSELLQGTAARVDRLRAQFRDGTIRVLYMNARHVGAGINLEAATHVVLYHRMNTELERQVVGRAVRFEREKELRVVHLVHEEETALTGSTSSEVIVHV